MVESLLNSVLLVKQQIQSHFSIIGCILLFLFGIYLLNTLLGGRLLFLGIIPRKLYGLPGIVLAPFIHAHFNHLFFNCIPLVVLSAFVLIQGITYFWFVTIFIIVVSGFLIWCFGAPGLHVGASAVISGYWGLLIANVYQQGSAVAILLGVVSMYYFAGIFFGIFPNKKGVSWEGHLFGLLAGILASILIN